MRPIGLSAFVRCKNEEEYIVASLMSAYRAFDEIVVIFNNSTDRTRERVADLMRDHQKIRVTDYTNECAPIGSGYLESVRAKPATSIAKYYNWCLEQTTFSHVCKWDGDMVATPVFEQVRKLIPSSEVVVFDGYDVLGENTTDMYEVLEHEYGKVSRLDEKCYLHMKLVKSDWLHKTWSSPNLLATRSVPETGARQPDRRVALTTWARRMARGLRRFNAKVE